MDMRHARSVPDGDRLRLRRELMDALADVPEELRVRVARTATLSAPEAVRLLEMAEPGEAGLDAEKVARARDVIERFAIAPR